MNLPLPVAVGIWVVLGVVLLLAVLTGRRRIASRSRHVVSAPPGPPLVDGALGDTLLGPLDCVYVSSTLHGDWLARVGAHGLGDRAQAEVTVYAGGVVVDRDGTGPLFVPADALRGVGTAPGMAGKFVGRDGLAVITWQVPDPAGPDATAEPTVLDTGLRLRHHADTARVLDALRPLLPSTPTAKDPQ
ncbi:hypothetical protein ATJ88_1939 [Isoptericola jiangsuensis]|uniref:PH domain-containing protein n=1 Tax=Isoptericola jiangsuensis TaxID=548579 RepID=A0A2A9EYF4_9MICO|nr:hypothetical protein [Isoptericola jiangsuensis]PFG43255.1 hypothetical protein ATJ88_1939 [Isoptericola jiangsuensis]